MVLTLLGKPPEPTTYSTIPTDEKPPDYKSVISDSSSPPFDARHLSPIEVGAEMKGSYQPGDVLVGSRRRSVRI